MSKIIVVFKDPQFMPLSFNTNDYSCDYSEKGTQKIFYVHKKIGGSAVLVVPWENLNHFYIAED